MTPIPPADRLHPYGCECAVCHDEDRALTRALMIAGILLGAMGLVIVTGLTAWWLK